MSNLNDLNLEPLEEFRESLSTYINQYMDEEKQDEEKLKKLKEHYKKIDEKLTSIVSAEFCVWTQETKALQQILQERNEEITAFIQEIAQIKEEINSTTAALGLIDKALELAAGIASKCATA